MADETAPVTGAENGAPAGAQFTVEKIYVKDVSFEAPNAPQVFNETGQPQCARRQADPLECLTQTPREGGPIHRGVG